LKDKDALFWVWFDKDNQVAAVHNEGK